MATLQAAHGLLESMWNENITHVGSIRLVHVRLTGLRRAGLARLAVGLEPGSQAVPFAVTPGHAEDDVAEHTGVLD
jgi:hypothetical protein